MRKTANEVWGFAGIVFLAIGVLILTVYRLERWLAKISDPDRLPPPVKVRKIKRKYEPPVARGRIVYPNSREGVISRELPENSLKN